MSRENVEVVRTLYMHWKDELFKLDDVVAELLDPDIEWDVSRRTFDPGVYHGHEGIREFVAGLQEVWESERVEPVEFIPAGDEVVVPVRLSFISRTDRQELSANAAHVWTLRDGKVIRHRVFQTKPEALDAVGLSG